MQQKKKNYAIKNDWQEVRDVGSPLRDEQPQEAVHRILGIELMAFSSLSADWNIGYHAEEIYTLLITQYLEMRKELEIFSTAAQMFRQVAAQWNSGTPGQLLYPHLQEVEPESDLLPSWKSYSAVTQFVHERRKYSAKEIDAELQKKMIDADERAYGVHPFKYAPCAS